MRILRLGRLLAGIALGLAPCLAAAENLLDLRYDRAQDQLVATIAYQGTHPDHRYRLEWGACEEGNQKATAQIVDEDGMDRVERDYTLEVRFGLAMMPCRPAEVTLRISPRIARSVQVPAR